MNNLKKTLAVVLAVAMVLSKGLASFAAFTDVPSTKNYAEAVNILNNLGIINGYEDGTFRPDNTITRAEVATIIVNALALGEQPGATVFSDVPADHWAAGYINTAYANKIIAGMGDGTFAPGADVTYEQVVKMIVSALNYEVAANRNGGYPTGYLAVASTKKITSGAAGTIGQPATRATVAKLLYNALEVGKLNTVSYTTTGAAELAEDENDTILSNLGVEKLEVIVTDTYLTADSYDPENTDITLAAAKTYKEDEDRESEYIDVDGLAKGAEIGTFKEGGTAAATLLGYSCVAYVGVDEDTDADTIFAISAKGQKNSVVTINSDQLDSSEDDGKKVRVFYRADGKTLKLTPSEDGVIGFKNFDATDAFDCDEDTEEYTAQIEEAMENGGVISFIDNNNDGEFDYVIANEYTGEGVVEAVEEEDGVWTFDLLVDNGGFTEYDTEDEDIHVSFIKGESYINVSEIAEGDTITTVANGEGTIIMNYVSSDKVEGKVTGYDSDDETYTIGGKSGLALSPLCGDSIKNTTGVYYLNKDGLIAGMDTSSTIAGEFGFVTGLDNDGKARPTYSVELVNAKGETVEYKLGTTLTVYNADGDREKVEKADYETYFEENVLDEVVNRVVRYGVSGTTLNKLYLAGYEGFEVGNTTRDRDYDASDMTLGGVTFTTSTVVFQFDGDIEDGWAEADDVSVGTVAKFFVDGEPYGETPIYYYGDEDAVDAVLASDLTVAIDVENPVFVVSNTEVKYMEDDELALVVTGVYGGAANTSFTLYDEDDPSVAEEYIDTDDDTSLLTKGDILLIGDIATGYITDLENLEVIAQVPTSGNRVDVTEHVALLADNYDDRGDGVYQDIAAVDGDVESGRIIVEGYTDENGLKPVANTNITVVDFTNTRISSVTVKKGTISAAKFNNSKYYADVYFRVYDTNGDVEDLQDVRADVVDLVIYKYDAEAAPGEVDMASVEEVEYDEEVVEETVEEEVEDLETL